MGARPFLSSMSRNIAAAAAASEGTRNEDARCLNECPTPPERVIIRMRLPTVIRKAIRPAEHGTALRQP